MGKKKSASARRLLGLILAACLIWGGLTGCARELTEEQSAALMALQSAVTYYETNDNLSHWEELVALAAANRADGIGVNWNALTLPDTPTAPILVPAQPEGTTGADSPGASAPSVLNPDSSTAGPGSAGVSSGGSPSDTASSGSNVPAAGGEDEGQEPARQTWVPIDVAPYPGAVISAILKGEDYAQMAASLAAGQNPENGAFSEAYVNQHAWSMITLTAALGESGYDYDRAAAYLLTYQREDGGFAYDLTAQESDTDLTGVAAVALAPYYKEHKRSKEMKALISYFSDVQLESGGYAGFGGENPSTIASAIWGLTALEQNLPSTEDGLSPVDALLVYQNEDGSFRAQKDGDHVFDSFSTRQAMIALGDVINDVEIYTLLSEDAESYRIENISGPGITLNVDFPDESDAADVSTAFTVEEGSSALDALILYGKIKEIPVVLDSGYVKSINGVSEKDYGDASGWIYMLNGQTPGQSASLSILSEGDTLSWIFVKDPADAEAVTGAALEESGGAD